MAFMDNNDNTGMEEEFDSPIFIFPDDDSVDDDGQNTSASSGSQDTDSDDGKVSTRLFGSSANSDSKESSHLSFGRVHATKKEKEFVFMPFLDDNPDGDDDEDEGEESSLSFGRVHAAKKEKEFIFMPFLNISDDDAANGDDASAKSYVVRPDGTVFDEGMILLPMSPLDDDDDDDDDDDSGDGYADDRDDDDDTGIYVTDASPEELARRPKRPPQSKYPSGKKGGKKKSSRSAAPAYGGSKKPKSGKGKGNPSAEEQFRAAMMNINPEIRRAAMRDPIQRAALEQAVRIALVQQAAQEAVARTTGSPGGYGNGFMGNIPQQAGKKNKKKRPASAPPAKSAAQNTNVRGFSLGGFSSAPADFGVVTPPSAPAPAQNMAAAAGNETHIDFMGSNESVDYTPAPVPVGVPDVAQDPVLASLTSVSPSANRIPASEQQDPALASLNASSSGTKQITSYSPAAIRAAMRAGIDLSLPQTAAAAASASQSSSSSQKAKLMESVNSRRSGCLVWLIVMFIVFFIGLLAIAVWPSLSTELKYQEASTMMASGNYIEASEMFAALDDYKDSEAKSSEAIYVYALALQNAGEYDKAIEYYSTISNYSATGERIAECRYIVGKQYMEAGDYASAYDQLHLIPRYNDAGELAKESNYRCALQLYNEGNYAGALVRFKMFPDYLDSASYWPICQYENARDLYNAGNYDDAYQQFMEISYYEDSRYYAASSQYFLIINGNASYTLEEVRESLRQLENHGSTHDRNMIESHIYTAAKLVGSWYDETAVSYIIFNAGDTASMTLCFTVGEEPGTERVIENVMFDNNIVYYMDGDEKVLLLRVESFSPAKAAVPNSLSVYCYYTDTTYTLYRTGQ